MEQGGGEVWKLLESITSKHEETDDLQWAKAALYSREELSEEISTITARGFSTPSTGAARTMPSLHRLGLISSPRRAASLFYLNDISHLHPPSPFRRPLSAEPTEWRPPAADPSFTAMARELGLELRSSRSVERLRREEQRCQQQQRQESLKMQICEESPGGMLHSGAWARSVPPAPP